MNAWGAFAAFGCAFAIALPACSRDEEAPKQQIDLTPGYARGRALPESGPPPVKAHVDEPWPGDRDASTPDPGAYQVMVTRTIVREAGPVPIPVNPDDAILERARGAAGSCFASLSAAAGSPPERSAHIVFTVIPTGTVSNADVSSPDTTDDRVLRCLREEAISTTFSDNNGGPLRTYAIDVRMIAKRNTAVR